MYQKTKLSQAVYTALVTSSLAGGSAMAQQDTAVMEEVYVQGIRGSLERSMDIKRDADGVVDAISAEDIGKFPDTNLAESLQRITGVSIDRRNGEGNEITVRGFGPGFNLVLLNGRHMPTSGVSASFTQGSNAQTDRSFDMSNLAAEGVSGVEVHKSSAATRPTGGIGATVNLKSRRPFDQDGFKAIVGAKALHDSTVRVGDDITPEYSTFLSWSNDTFGASLAYTDQERHSARSGVFTNNWSTQTGRWSDASLINSVPYDGSGNTRIDGQPAPDINPEDVNIINEPLPDVDPSEPGNQGQQTNLTDGIRYFHRDHERTRENAQLTLQYRPIDDLTLTLDHTMAEQELFGNGAELSFWYGGGTFPTTDVQFDQGPQVRTSEYIWLENPTGVVRDIGVTQNQTHVVNELESTGINAEWDFSDTLSFELDFHSSEATSLPPNDDTIGTVFNIALGAQGVWAQGYDNSGDLPLLVGVYGDDNRGDENDDGVQGDIQSTGITSGELDVEDLGGTVRQGWYARSREELDQFRVSGSWEFSDRGSIDFGVDSRALESRQRVSSLQEVMEGGWGVNTPGDVADTGVEMQELNYADLFDGYNTGFTGDSAAFFGQAGLDDNPRTAFNSGQEARVFTRGWIAEDVKELGRELSANADLPWAPAPTDGTDRTIEEDINAFYVQGSYEFDLGTMPLNTVFGIRYEDTEVTSTARIAPERIEWQGDNDLITNPVGAAGDQEPTVGTGEYDHTLPNLSLSLGITDDLIGRFAYSTSISRPNYGNMQEGINGVQPPNGGPTILGAAPGTASNGNPNLEPLESDNFDLSLEWYYGDSSYASVGYFRKDVTNFIGTEVENQIVPTTRDQTAGPRAQAAIEELEARGLSTSSQQNLFQMVAANSTEGDGCVTTGEGGASCGADFDAFPYESWEDNVDVLPRDDDPQYEARVGFPVGDKSAELDGWEFAVQHFFGESGFGVQANYTLVDSKDDDLQFDITGSPTDTQFALTGLSDSANLVLIYEKNDLSTRLAYNWRDEFLWSTAASAREPGHTEAYEQYDLNVSYNITDQWSASFEAINLTGEDQRNFARTKRQLLDLQILDTRYALGVRYEF